MNVIRQHKNSLFSFDPHKTKNNTQEHVGKQVGFEKSINDGHIHKDYGRPREIHGFILLFRLSIT